MSNNILSWLGSITNTANAYDVCHVAIAYGVMLTMGPAHHWLTLMVIAALAAVKEFWYDIRYETAAVSGGYSGGWRDFAGYMAGAALALLRFWL